MIITDRELQKEAKKYLMYAAFWLKNPVSFIYMNGIARMLPYQAECLQSIVDNKRTIVRSGHGAGKTFIMALAACWWLCFHWLRGEGCSVIVTSPTQGNLTTVFWPQFSKCMDLFPEYLKNHFTITAESAYCNEDSYGWRIDLRTARKDNPDAMAGQHNVLFLIDEWSGVHYEIYRVIEGAMSDAGSRILAIGNPLRTQGWGYEAFTKNQKLWHCIHIDCSIFTTAITFETKWIDVWGDEQIDRNTGRVDPKEVQKYLDLCGGNRDALEFCVRVRGEFPSEAANQFINRKLCQDAISRAPREEEEIEETHVLALDPAASMHGDEICLLHRHGPNIMSIKLWHEESTRKIAFQVREWLNNEGSSFKFKFLAIDTIGIGLGVYDSLCEMHRRGEIKNLEYISQYKSSYESPQQDDYDRMRDWAFHLTKQWLIHKTPSFPKHQPQESALLMEELTCFSFDFNNRGALKIESKKDLKKRGIKSPNIADALSQTFSQPDKGYVKSGRDRYTERYHNNEAPLSWKAV